MNIKELNELGISVADLESKLLDRLVEGAMRGTFFEEDGEPCHHVSGQLDKMVKAHIDAGVRRIGDEHVSPKVDALLEGVCLQSTNKWGEAKGKALTFKEYLVQRASGYMTEMVDFNGKTKEQVGYGWRADTARVTHLIERHLEHSIKLATETAMKELNKSVADGIAETVKLKLAETLDSIKRRA